MTFVYEEDLVEEAVLLRASERSHTSPDQCRRFHRERAELYEIKEADQRNEVFFKFFLEWFREWNFERPLREVAGEFPLLARHLVALVFRKARGKQDEAADLFVSPAGERRGIISLRVPRLLLTCSLVSFLRKELMHVSDMLDPVFAYQPLIAPGRELSSSEERLIRARYRSLWNLTISGRLAGHQGPAPGQHDQVRAEFEQSFGFLDAPMRKELFNSFWHDPQPRHDRLMRAAANPRGLEPCGQPAPGALCPLCGFPAFDWADLRALSDRTAKAIGQEFPHWERSHGACGRCIEMFLANEMMEEAL